MLARFRHKYYQIPCVRKTVCGATEGKALRLGRTEQIIAARGHSGPSQAAATPRTGSGGLKDQAEVRSTRPASCTTVHGRLASFHPGAPRPRTHPGASLARSREGSHQGSERLLSKAGSLLPPPASLLAAAPPAHRRAAPTGRAKDSTCRGKERCLRHGGRGRLSIGTACAYAALPATEVRSSPLTHPSVGRSLGTHGCGPPECMRAPAHHLVHIVSTRRPGHPPGLASMTDPHVISQDTDTTETINCPNHTAGSCGQLKPGRQTGLGSGMFRGRDTGWPSGDPARTHVLCACRLLAGR